MTIIIFVIIVLQRCAYKIEKNKKEISSIETANSLQQFYDTRIHV